MQVVWCMTIKSISKSLKFALTLTTLGLGRCLIGIIMCIMPSKWQRSCNYNDALTEVNEITILKYASDSKALISLDSWMRMAFSVKLLLWKCLYSNRQRKWNFRYCHSRLPQVLCKGSFDQLTILSILKHFFLEIKSLFPLYRTRLYS